MPETLIHTRESDIVATGIGSWLWDVESDTAHFDTAWLQLIGYDEDEIPQTRLFWTDRIHPEDKPLVLALYDKLQQEHQSGCKVEYRLKSQRGNYVHVLDIATVTGFTPDELCKMIHIQTVNVTGKIVISDQKHDERYKSIFEHLNDAFCRFDFSGQVLEVNQNLCKLLDIDEAELRASNIKLYFNNKTIKYLYRNLTKILENEHVSFETTIINKKGRDIPVSVNAKLITVSKNGVVQALIRDITDRKVYEKALFGEKLRYQALVEHAPMVITRFGKNLRCQYASPNISKMIGRTPEFCVGKRLLEMNFPLSLSKYLEEKIKWVCRRNKVLKINFSLESGLEIKYFDAILVPETNVNTEVESVLITCADITEKVNGEKELIFSRQRLEEFEKSVHFGTYEIVLETGLIKWSREASLIYERDPADPAPTLDDFFYNYLHPDDFVFVTGSIQDCSRNATNLNLIYKVITANGNVKYVNDMIRTELHPDTGKPFRLQGTIVDITEKKLIENRLAAEHDILQVIMDNVPDAIYLKNDQGQFIRANKAMADLFLLKGPEELIGKTSYDFYPKNIADEITESEQQIYATGGPIVNQENEFEYSSGKHWLSTTLVGVRDSSGKVTQIAGISRNINQYKEAQAQLRKAKEKAEVADKLKSAFLANMSHEIRTPINGILGFANLLEIREFSRDKEVRYLRIINNSGKLLLNLINDIIDIAKIEAGQITIENAQIDLNELMVEINEFYKVEKKRREKEAVEIVLEMDKSIDRPYITTDPLRLKQIVNNLISNALKFTEEGQITFGYRFEHENVLFYVKDSGIGMTKNETEMVFERFKQAGIASRKKEGTGLGLAISKGLVELLGGRIWVTSQQDVGSTFYFYIPLHLNRENSGILGLEKGFDIVSGYNWQGKYILLVEDEEVNHIYIRELLVNTGINLIHAATAEEAIEICKSSCPIDLILMDMRLPGINGFEATRLVKKIRIDIPVIAQTAYAMENERKDCLEAGCDHYLTKPFDQEGLFRIINNFI